MNDIEQILGSRRGRIFAIGPQETVFAAMQSMAEHGIGALLVMDKGKPVGLISERDYARKVVLERRSSETTRVDEIMSKKLICATLKMGRKEAMTLMAKNKIRHLPVFDEAKQCVGVVSIRDFVQDIEGEDDE